MTSWTIQYYLELDVIRILKFFKNILKMQLFTIFYQELSLNTNEIWIDAGLCQPNKRFKPILLDTPSFYPVLTSFSMTGLYQTLIFYPNPVVTQLKYLVMWGILLFLITFTWGYKCWKDDFKGHYQADKRRFKLGFAMILISELLFIFEIFGSSCGYWNLISGSLSPITVNGIWIDLENFFSAYDLIIFNKPFLFTFTWLFILNAVKRWLITNWEFSYCRVAVFFLVCLIHLDFQLLPYNHLLLEIQLLEIGGLLYEVNVFGGWRLFLGLYLFQVSILMLIYGWRIGDFIFLLLFTLVYLIR